MSRIRALLLSMGLILVVLLAQSASQAQAPGGRGRGGPGGFGGRNRVSSPLSLASNVYVQEDLKLTDAQKKDIKELSDKVDQQRREMFPRRGGQDNDGQAAEAGTNQGQTAQANRGGESAKGRSANGGSNRGRQGGNNGGRSSNFGNGGGNANFGGGGGGRPNFEAMRAMGERLNAEAEAALAKILTKPQRERIVQIQLQQEGPMAVTKPAMQKRLNMSPDQIQQIAMVLQTREQAQNDLRQAGGQLFQAFRTPDGGFNREAMQARMQDPQFKAQMEKMRTESSRQRELLEDQTITMIGKALTKKQHQNFAKMQGRPFDLEKLSRNYNPAAAAAKAKEQEEAAAAEAKEESSSKKGSTSKKKSSTKSRRGN